MEAAAPVPAIVSLALVALLVGFFRFLDRNDAIDARYGDFFLGPARPINFDRIYPGSRAQSKVDALIRT